ncbi:MULTISPECIES: hypothetical protein [unclassified Rhizobium]|uniref:hypothetical protein n=1 Tax=unclassified Rhizobium TaxID=2613769 RepID=UPI001AE23F49|nr:MULTISPECIES: hypothetical protein [unclassified Rhizobium]MBP2459567.1 hypothetical protein [Rhizobium sp. PvP014]MBP2531861.1 hypothetical protein [Rhizobium sp. PvP099]
MQISKIDAARRQLLAAIHIQWFLLEPMAANQLAANAAEICDALLRNEGKLRIREQIEKVHGMSPKEAAALINVARNFAKHADRDPDALSDDLSSEDVDAVILTACIDYSMASGRSHYVIGLFISWYAAINPKKMGDMFYQPARELFPNLSGIGRAAQVAAARHVSKQLPARGLIDHARNELTDNWRWVSLRDLGDGLRLPTE